MAQKAPILLYKEAQDVLVNNINYFIQQGVEVYEMRQIVNTINNDLAVLEEKELTKATEDYQKALEEERRAAETMSVAEEVIEDKAE